MPVNAGIYQNMKTQEVPSIAASQGRVATLKGLALQNQDAENTVHLQKASRFGTTLESMAGMSAQERAANYPKVRQQLISEGVLGEQDAPPDYDDGFYRQSLMKYRKSSEGIDRRLKEAQISKLYAESAADKAKKNLTPGEESADKEFGKEAADYYYGGGKSGVEKSFGQLDSALGKLEADKDLTGGWTTKIPGLGSDVVQDVINPKMASVRDEIRGAVQSSLKKILGGQYTEKEGADIFNRSFNPRLSTEENIARAKAEVDTIKRMAAEKDRSMQHFMASGTLKGYRPGGTELSPGSRETQTAQTKGGGRIWKDLGIPAAQAAELGSGDIDAIKWARKNPKDPRAATILKLNGVE